ncbi:MAG: hypothetical protein QOG89_2914 [Thermomicrobiales bacterium]|nr:hypothetical protein [Thermomicrobiales bacterium]
MRIQNRLIVLVLMMSAIGAIDPTEATAEATPAAVTFPISPDASQCKVQPRPLADFERLLLSTPQSDAAAPASSTPFVVPDGEPADAIAVSGVTATLIELFACYHAGDPRRFHALFTDEGLQRAFPPGMVTQEFVDEFFAASPVPEDDPALRATILAIEDVVVLIDGRVGALLRSDEPEFGGLQAVYYIFAKVGDRYLVDDVIHGLPTDDSTAEASTPTT